MNKINKGRVRYLKMAQAGGTDSGHQLLGRGGGTPA